MTRPVVDEAPLSEFVRKMRAVFVKREAAKTNADKREAEREMESLMRQYLGRSAWDAMGDAEAVEQDVPRDTRVDSTCHTYGVQSDRVDWKQRAARNDD